MQAVEEELYAGLGYFLTKQGWDPERAICQVLTLAKYLSLVRDKSPCEAIASSAPAVSSVPVDDNAVAFDFAPEVSDAAPLPEIPDEQETPPLGAYVVSIQPKSGFRRLHRVGECTYRPGVHYGVFEMLGDSPPAASEFHARCKLCYPGEAPKQEADEESATSSGSSSPDSSIE